MKTFKTVLIATLCVSFSAIAEVAVVVHPSNTSELDKATVNKIFTGKQKSFSNGEQVVAINQDEGLPVTDSFNDQILSKSSSQLKAYWSKLVFTGKGTPPKNVANDAEVLKLVAANPNIIGYVDASAVNDSVKVVFTF